jgi:hypothetical protein
MNIKRKLLKLSQKDNNVILNDNKDFFDSYILSESKTKKKSMKTNLITVLSCLIVLMTIAMIPFYINSSKIIIKTYNSNEEASQASSLEEINIDLINSRIVLTDMTINNIILKYDISSNDKLFYNINLEQTSAVSFEKINVKVNVNKNYNLIFLMDDNNLFDTIINNFNVKYTVNESIDDIFYEYYIKAKIITDDEIYYIEYEQTSMISENNFFDFVSKCILNS